MTIKTLSFYYRKSMWYGQIYGTFPLVILKFLTCDYNRREMKLLFDQIFSNSRSQRLKTNYFFSNLLIIWKKSHRKKLWWNQKVTYLLMRKKKILFIANSVNIYKENVENLSPYNWYNSSRDGNFSDSGWITSLCL